MRSFSPTVQLLLDQDALSVFFLIDIYFSTGQLKHTSFPYDLTIPGLGTYTSNNNLKNIDSPRLSNVVDREVYKIVYSDNEMEMIGQLSNNAVGRVCMIHIGFVNSTEQTLAGTAPGNPILNYQDIVLGYKGIIDTYGYTVSPEGEILCSIECSSPMAALDIVRPIYTSDDAIRKLNQYDDCFSEIHVASSSVTLLWGKT